MEKMIILNQKENPLFNRKEVEIDFEANVAPKIQEAENIVAEKLSSKPENVKIKKIKGFFGSRKFIISANVYHSKEDKEKIERKSKKEKAAEAKPEEKKE